MTSTPVTVREHPDKTQRKNWEEDFKKFKTRVYYVGQDAVLSDLDMEEGDELRGDENYEIISSRIEQGKDGRRVAVVTAMAYVTV